VGYDVKDISSLGVDDGQPVYPVAEERLYCIKKAGIRADCH